MTAEVKSVYRLLLNRVLELDLRPVHGIDQNPATRALAGLGVAPGQGYLLGRLMPADG